jgi:hypothetical protein
MKKLLAALGLSVALMGTALAAVPTLSQVQQSIGQHNWQQADDQLAQVTQAYPNNPRAHYLYGQVLAREGRASDALAQIEQARSLDPELRFTDASRFAQVERQVRGEAKRLGQSTGSVNAAPLAQPAQAAVIQQPVAAPVHHSPSFATWGVFAVVIAGVIFVLRKTIGRVRNSETQQSEDERRAQLKRATDVLNAVRPLKLDARLSTAPGADKLVTDIENLETQARTVVDTLSNSKTPVAPYQVDGLVQQLESLQARVAGRPDPHAAPLGAPGSVYAQEADRVMGVPPGYPPGQPYPPQYPPQPVVVQQGGGFGGGIGGLLTGVLLGEAMSGGRERVIERDVIVDDRNRNQGDQNFDLGQSDDWSNGSDGGVDMGGGDNWN